MRSPIQTSFEDLPDIIPVFPLSRAMLLPGGRLPLNIFEPRYLNMTLDALSAGRIFGMIQPDHDHTPKHEKHDKPENGGSGAVVQLRPEPVLFHVGCTGRISSFEETEDGRLLITLKGLARYRIVEEVEGHRGYRRCRVSYDDYKDDMKPPPRFELDRAALMERLKPYLDAQGMRINLDAIKGLSENTLVTSLCMICPFDPREKQALLEAPSMEVRATTLIALLQMGVFGNGGKPEGRPQ